MKNPPSVSLQSLTDQVSSGMFVDSPWLRKHGYTKQLVSSYMQNGWLRRAAPQLYQRPQLNQATAPEWVNLVYSSQSIMRYDIHVGGLSSLHMQGLLHYLKIGGHDEVWLYGRNIPTFFEKIETDANIKQRKGTLFLNPQIGIQKAIAPNTGILLDVSSPERAILEYINEIKPEDSWHQFEVLFEGLINLRPRLMSQVLESCSKIKVKRLFCVMAGYFNHPWFQRMDFFNTELGSAPRAFVKGGRLHPTYNITVPMKYLSPTDGTAQE